VLCKAQLVEHKYGHTQLTQAYIYDMNNMNQCNAQYKRES